MRTLLAAVEKDEQRDLKPASAAAMGGWRRPCPTWPSTSTASRRKPPPARTNGAAISRATARCSCASSPPRSTTTRSTDRHALSRGSALPRGRQCYIGEFESLLARQGRRWRRPSDLHHAQRRYGQDLSRRRLCAGAAVARQSFQSLEPSAFRLNHHSLRCHSRESGNPGLAASDSGCPPARA